MANVDQSQITPDTAVQDLFPSGAQATVFGTFIEKISRMYSDRFVSTCRTIGEAYEFCEKSRRSTTLSEDLMSPTTEDDVDSPVWLRSIQSSDLPAMYAAAQDPRSAFRWRFRGPFPSPSQFSEYAFRGVWQQFIVVNRQGDHPVGLVVAYDAIPEYGICYLAMQRYRARLRGGEMMLGMFHLVDYLFLRWPFRKLFVDMPEVNDYLLEGFPVVEYEGRLRAFSYYDEHHWDRVFWSISRQRWQAAASAWRPYLRRGFEGGRSD